MSAYRRILVAVDGSPTSMKGLREAVRLAREEQAGLCIVHVVNASIPYAGLAGPPVNLVAMMLGTGRGVLKKALAQARRQGVEAKTILVESAARDVAGQIVAQARKERADLIVLGTHGRRGMRRLVLGSDAAQVVGTTTVPVLLVRRAG